MSWQDQLNGDSLTWLIHSDIANVRYLALRDLLDRPSGDPELQNARSAAHHAGPIAAILAEMSPEGWWAKPGPGYSPKYRSTVWSLVTLAQLGARVEEDERIGLACAYLMAHALTDGGHFSYNGTPSGTIDCLQGNLCWALTTLGYQDNRLEKAYDWMARTVTGEGIARCRTKPLTSVFMPINAARVSLAEPIIVCPAHGARSK